jgi:hypothetical protein
MTNIRAIVLDPRIENNVNTIDDCGHEEWWDHSMKTLLLCQQKNQKNNKMPFTNLISCRSRHQVGHNRRSKVKSDPDIPSMISAAANEEHCS